MRTAAEIIQQVFDESPHDAELKSLYEKAINKAREEAIRECAEVAETKNISRNPYEEYNVVDKQSILNLINQIK